MTTYTRMRPRWSEPEEPSDLAVESELSQRPSWWLRLTSSGWNQPQRTIEDRDRVRRSRLTAWIILGLFVIDAILIVASVGDVASLATAGAAAAGLVVIALINRAGWVTVAGTLLVLLLTGAIMGALVGEPGGRLYLDALPGYDLLAIGVVVAASVLPRAMAFVIATLNSGLIVLDFYLQPHNADLTADLQNNFNSTTEGILSILLRPIALQLIIAIIAFLWVRGTEQAISRADRAEELAAMEHQLVEQKRQIDIGIQQVLQTHIRAANGDFSARAPLGQDNVLFQIASSLNNLLNRLGRAAQAQYVLQRTVQEIGRLRESLLAARAGRPPLWPMPSGTPVDDLLEIIIPGTPGPRLPPGSAAPYPPAPTFGGPSGPLGPGAAPRQGDSGPRLGTPAWSPNPPPPGYFSQPAPFGQPQPFPPPPATGGFGPGGIPDLFAPRSDTNLPFMPEPNGGGASGNPFSFSLPVEPAASPGADPAQPSTRPQSPWDMPDMPESDGSSG